MAALLLPALAGCAEQLPVSQGLSGTVTVSGSSTLTPLVTAERDEWVEQVEPGVAVDITTTGTTAGIERLCDGTADVAMASRPITAEETEACQEAGVEPVPLPVAQDAITLVVPQRNDYVRCLTVAEVAAVMVDPGEDGPAVTTWADVRPGWPATTLVLFGPGPGSGTTTLFDSEVLDGAGQRPDVATSEDDRVVVQGVAASPGGFGYLPLTYAADAADSVRPVAVDAGAGCVEPSARTVSDGSYTPLARPLQLYVSGAAFAERPAVAAFVEHVVDRAGATARELGGVPPSAEQELEAATALDSLGEASG